MQNPKKTLRGVALAIATCFGDNVDDVRETEYQPGRFKDRVYVPFGKDYYTATAGRDPFDASQYPGWEGMEWDEITPDWFSRKYNNRVFVLGKKL